MTDSTDPGINSEAPPFHYNRRYKWSSCIQSVKSYGFIILFETFTKKHLISEKRKDL